MKKQTFSNTFVGGMIQDIDSHEQPNNTYRYSIGGRIIQNVTENDEDSMEENVKAGVSRAYVVVKGNKFVFSLCPGYTFTGACETRKGALIMSTNGLNSELGFMEINDNVYKTGFSSYTTLFNDRNDPNGDLLHFHRDKYVNGSFDVYENEFTERVYWVDDYNQKRVVNLAQFYKADGTTYHNQQDPCNGTSIYPKHLSVHAFDERMDLVFPKLKLWKRIPGALKSGQYQLVMKYLSKNGHSSVWSYITRATFVTDQKMDGDIIIGSTTYSDAYQDNHHNRTMGASNIMTEEGLSYTLEELDTRWDQVVVGYIYHASSVAFQEANQYRTYDITGPDLVVDLLAHTGIAITKAELNQRFETALKVGSTAQQENRTWDGNIQLLGDLAMDLSGVKIRPHFRYFKPDMVREPKFNNVFNPVSGRNDNDPLTNSVPMNSTFTVSNFDGDLETYATVNDYVGYKGQLFSTLFRGYFRGETQPYAFLWIDRKGNPLFAQHITDYTFPNQFDTVDSEGNAIDATLCRQNPDGSYDFRIMGAMFDNITIPADLIYDKFGKLNVSGFMIVRTERIKRIANQGVLFNCVQNFNDQTNTDQDKYVQPQTWVSNKYSDEAVGDDSPNAFNYEPVVGTNYACKFECGDDKIDRSLSAPFYFNYYSPDILIEQAMPKDPTKANLQLIGFAHKAYSKWVELDGMKNHVYTKNYKTLPINWSIYYDRLMNSRPALATKSRIAMALLHTNGVGEIYDKFDPERGDVYDYRADVWVCMVRDLNNGPYPGPPGLVPSISASQQKYSLILKLSDFAAVDFIEDDQSPTTMTMANWLQTPNDYYTADDTSSLEKRRYFSTGHFQQITENILNKVKKIRDENGLVTHFVFDKVEVWGGDCYVNPFDFARLIPEYTDCNKGGSSFYPDYSVSHIVPIESKYNLALLYGRKFAANAVNPQRAACGDQNRKQFANGIQRGQPESWNYNEVLLLEESTKFYLPKPANQKIVTNQDSTVRWSPKKIYGELEDSYRQRLVDDYADVIGEFGKITKFCQGFDYLYIIQEKAFGAALTRVERFIPSDAGDIMVKSGDAFGGMRYISKIYGCQHPNSVVAYNNNITFTDARKGKILVFNQAGLKKQSEEEFLDNPIAAMTMFYDREVVHQNDIFVDIIGGIDTENDEVLTTFVFKGVPNDPGIQDPKNRQSEMKSFTVGYSSKLGVWQGYHHFVPTIYFNVGRYLFSDNPTTGKENELYVYNHGKYGQWFGKYYETILEYITNPQPNTAKTFDNSWINVGEDGFVRISKAVHRVNKNVHTIDLTNRDNAEFIEESLRYPIFEEDFSLPDDKPRLRGNFMVTRLFIDNSQQEDDGEDLQVAITNIDTQFRISNPIQY